MDLIKMFAAQAKLDERIGAAHPEKDTEDRLMDTCLALLVELGELAQEQRTWKYWSHDREPRKENIIECPECKGSGYSGLDGGYCGSCHGGYVGVTNPLLEEYADVMHFTLSIGNRIGFREDVTLPEDIAHYVQPFPTNWSASSAFGYVYRATCSFMEKAMYRERNLYYLDLFRAVLGLAIFLGFTWEDIEKAYYEKNNINYARLESGY